MFSCEFYEISKNKFFTEHLWTAASGVSPREIIKVAPQVKKSKKNLQEVGSANIYPESFFVKFWDLNPVSMLQLSVYKKYAYNENICSVKCFGKSAAKIIQNIQERVHISYICKIWPAAEKCCQSLFFYVYWKLSDKFVVEIFKSNGGSHV